MLKKTEIIFFITYFLINSLKFYFIKPNITAY